MRSSANHSAALGFGFFLLFLLLAASASGGQEDMVLIPAGQFQMGSNDHGMDEKPVHLVHLDAFYMDKYEVTNSQYCNFLNEKGNQLEGKAFWLNNSQVTWLNIGDDYCRITKLEGKYIPKSGYENHPAIDVTWYGARAYAAWSGKRLPTEAEWEYAARGGLAQQNYPWGNSISSSMANLGDKIGDTTPVGNYPPNGYGLYDMAGNVCEWCADHPADYTNSTYDNSTGASSGNDRVIRGGSWQDYEGEGRCWKRHSAISAVSDAEIGFRCVR